MLHSAINQAVVLGEARPYNVAIIAPNPALKQKRYHINAAIEEAKQHLPDYAKISAWLFADEPFSIANQQLSAIGMMVAYVYHTPPPKIPLNTKHRE